MVKEADSPFQLVLQYKTPFDIIVSKYQSQATGLRVILTDVDVPIVHGYIAVATEECDSYIDKGLPHTLEHLVFLGSEDYPYKGVLDTLACKAFAHGTNAWTAVDHTCYTISTAGCEGFLNILPIYLDHVLFPTLTEAGFTTEVYHINGKGEDGGVVYSEMQGRENTSDDLSSHRIHQLLYPAPSGYGSETGGLMRKIRELDIELIRKFHAQHYRPENLCIAIFGKVNPADVLKAILPIDQKIKSKPALPPFERPWVGKPIPELKSSVTESITFPDEDESIGELHLAYRGPPVTDFETIHKLDTLLEYLTDSPLSLLKQAFVEREDLACTDVDFEIHQYSLTSITLSFHSVYVQYLEKIPKQIPKLLAKHQMDMKRMHEVIVRQKHILLNSVESHPESALFSPIMADFLYGAADGSHFQGFYDRLAYLDQQLRLPSEAWTALLQQYFLNTPCVTLMAKPSESMVEKLANESAARVKERIEKFGPQRLVQLQDKLNEAMRLNDLPVPDEMVKKFPCVRPHIVFPKVTIAHYPNTQNLRNPLQDRLDGLAPFPFTLQLASIQSEFITVFTTWNLGPNFPSHLLPYLGVYLELMFTSAVHPPQHKYMPYEEVVQGLDRDLVSYSNACGFNGDTFSCGLYATQVVVSMRVIQENYAKAIQWLKWVLFHTVVEWKRLAIVVKKMVGDIPQYKREASFMTSTFLRQSIFKEDTTYNVLGLPKQEPFLKNLSERIQSQDPTVLNHFQELKTHLHSKEQLRLSLSGNFEKYPSIKEEHVQDALLSPWISFFEGESNTALQPALSMPPTTPIMSPYELLNPLGMSPHSEEKGKLISLPAIESGYLCCISKGLDHPMHEDVPALMVALEFFSATEGVFWKHLRGAGLAYGCDLSLELTTRHLRFFIYRSHDVVTAWSRAAEMVEAFVQNKMDLDPAFLDAAKSSLIYSLTSRVKSSTTTASLCFFQALIQGLPNDFQFQLMEKVFQVTLDQAIRAAKKYLPSLFNPASSLMVAACSPSKVDGIRNGFKAIGFDLEVVTMDDDGSEASEGEE